MTDIRQTNGRHDLVEPVEAALISIFNRCRAALPIALIVFGMVASLPGQYFSSGSRYRFFCDDFVFLG
jgi:hypothetical protein